MTKEQLSLRRKQMAQQLGPPVLVLELLVVLGANNQSTLRESARVLARHESPWNSRLPRNLGAIEPCAAARASALVAPPLRHLLSRP